MAHAVEGVMLGDCRCPEAPSVSIQFLNEAAWSLTLGTALVFAATFILRRGLGDSSAAVFYAFLLSLLPVWLSVAAMAGQRTLFSLAAAALVGILAGLIIPVSGIFLGTLASSLASVVALISFGYVQWRCQGIRRAAWLRIALMALASALAIIVFTEPYHFFIPETILLGTASVDQYYVSAISQMIAHYHVSSLGADGLEPTHYHVFSMIVVAGIAKSSGLAVSASFLYWGGFATKTLFVWAFIAASYFFLQRQGVRRASAETIASYAWIASLLIGNLESESFVLGLSLLLATSPVLILLISGELASSAEIFTAIILALVGSMFCAAAKISAGFLCVPALLLALWRFRRQTGIAVAIVSSLVVLALFVRKYIAANDLSSFPPLRYFLLGYYGYLSDVRSPASYFLSFIVILLSCLELKVGAREKGVTVEVRHAWNADEQRPLPHIGPTNRIRRLAAFFLRLTPIAQYMALMAAACAAVFLSIPIGGNNAYFTLLLFGMAFFFLPVVFSESLRSELDIKIIRNCVLILFGVLLLYRAGYFWLSDQSLPHVVSALYKAAFPPQEKPRVIQEMIASTRQGRLPFSTLRDKIDVAPFALTAKAIEDESRKSGSLAVFIPPYAAEVWSGLANAAEGGFWCFSGHLVVPALTGVMEIRSISPRQTELQCLDPGMMPSYGFGPEQEKHRSSDLPDGKLCEIARRWSANSVYKLVSYRDRERNSVINCGQKSSNETFRPLEK